jgi:xanthine/uracil permease
MDMKQNIFVLLGGFQWLFFMFANTVVIPISIGTAFNLDGSEIVTALQQSFILTGVACVLQGWIGHRLSIMEGQSGLWWGVILNIAAMADTLHLNVAVIGGSIAVGSILSGLLVSLLGLFGLAGLLKKWFTPIVMFVFLLLLANQLIFTFLKGMLGLNTGNHINLGIACFSILLAAFTIIVNIKGKGILSNLALLIGMTIGWLASTWLFPAELTATFTPHAHLTWFPLGAPTFIGGIVFTVVITGLLNTSNTIATLKGVENIYQKETSTKQYKFSLIISGAFTSISGFLGLVPYAPYASSLGFLQSTGIRERLPFFLGSVMFIVLGMVPQFISFFSTIPQQVGNTILFVAYCQLFLSALRNIEGLRFTPKTGYRIAIPSLLGMSIMNMPKEAFATIPALIKPLLSNGLLVGILVALFMELISWSSKRFSNN